MKAREWGRVLPAGFATINGMSDRERLVDEIARQYEVLRSGPWQRNALIFCGYSLCALYSHPVLMIVLAAVDISLEMLCLRLMRGLDPVASPWRYAACTVLIILMSGIVSLAAGLTWLQNDPFGMALASGFSIIVLLELSSVRSIHLPFAIVGLITATSVLMGSNVILWMGKGDTVGFIVMTVGILAALTYAVLAMLSTHRMHDKTAQTLAEARASDAAKSYFLAQLSHELRTPLNAIIGLGEMEAGTAVGTSRDRLQTLVTSARDLAELLDDVLDLSAINTGQLSVAPQAVDVRATLSTAVAIAAPKRSSGSDSPSLQVAPAVPVHAFVDGHRLRQCLINLISNATKHADGKGVELRADYEMGRLIVEVADGGPGIPRDVARTLFEPFRRGPSRRPGLGLGLAISRSLARRMGGDLTLVPTQGGALFRLVVVAPACDPPVRNDAFDLSRRRIMVVDDVATNRMVAASLLRRLGAEIVEAKSGREAIALLEKAPVDIVLLDIAMPEMDGFETLRLMRAGPGRNIPVVAQTAGATPEQRREIEAAGFDGLLPKPILPENIGPALARHLILRPD